MHTFWRTWLGISRKFTFNARAIPTIERDFTLPHWSHSLQTGQDQRALPETQNIRFLSTFHCKVQGHIYRGHHVYCVFRAITLMVPEVRAWSLATINSCPSLLISFTYLNSATGIWFDFRTKNLHGIRTLTASINLFSSVHGTVCCAHPRFLPNL